MTILTRRALILAGPLLLLTLTFTRSTGCGRAAQLYRPLHAYVGFDTSAGCRAHLALYARLALKLSAGLQPGSDQLTLFRVDHTTQEFYDAPVPDSTDDLEAALAAELGPHAAAPGTFPASFWQNVARRSASDTGPVVVVLFSDGDNDDESGASMLSVRQAALRLAHSPRVERVAILGASRSNWALLRDEFGPLGGRLSLMTTSELTDDSVALTSTQAGDRHAH